MLFSDLPEDYEEIFAEKTLQERLRLLLEYEPEPEEPTQKRRRTEDEGIHINDRLFALLIVEARCMAAFKRLLNTWIKRRADKIPVSDVDAITLSPYNQPLIVYNMNLRSRHCFETKTLITNIYHQLRYSFGGFPKPLSPLNPITNLGFHAGQLTHIFDHAIPLGYYSAPFAAFRNAAFDIHLYNYLEERPLRFAAIREFVYGINHRAFMLEELLNFIVGAGNKRQLFLVGAEIRKLSFGLRQRSPYVDQWLRIFAEYLQYDLKATPQIRYCPEQIKKSGALSAEINILIDNLRSYLHTLTVAYNTYCAEQQQNVAAEMLEDEEEEEYEDEENDAIIFQGTIDNTFQVLLQRLLGPGGPMHR